MLCKKRYEYESFIKCTICDKWIKGTVRMSLDTCSFASSRNTKNIKHETCSSWHFENHNMKCIFCRFVLKIFLEVFSLRFHLERYQCISKHLEIHRSVGRNDMDLTD